MDSKLIISNILTGLTLASKTKFVEAKDNEDLISLAKSKGIDLPSPDLACFETYYCELDKPNLNNAMLTKKAAEEGINSLIGKQINLNHEGKNYVVGYTIDAKIKENMIVATGILFKSLWQDEFDEIQELFESGKLFVSFELWNREPETGDSIIEIMEDGVKKITKMIAHGVGLLLKGVNPACRKAQVFKLLANQKDNGEQIFQEDDRFAYASFSNEVETCTHCTTCSCNKEKEVTIVEEIKVEEIAKERLCPECNQPMKDEDKEMCAECLKKKEKSSEETQAEVAPVETKTEETPNIEAEVKVEEPIAEVKIEEKSEVAETKTEETKPEETKEEVVEEVKEEATTITTTQEVTKVEEIKPEGEVITTEVKTETTVVNDEGKETQKVEEEIKTIVTYTNEQLEVKVQEAKVELQKLIEEKDKEIAQLKQELGQKDQEIADLKNPIVEEKKAKVLTVGSVETEKISETKKQANKINDIIASKGNR